MRVAAPKPNPLSIPVVILAGVLAGVAASDAVARDRAAESTHVAPAPPFQEIVVPAGAGSMAPRCVPDGDGALVSWLEPTGNGSERRLQVAALGAAGFDVPRTVVEGVPFFANWADTPSVVRGGDDALYAHWLQKSGRGTYAYDAVVARSADDGASWTTLGPLHRDGIRTEHGFVSFVPVARGVRAFWLDGRAMSAGGDAAGGAGGHGAGAMSVRTARVGAEGVSDGFRLDARACECCNTDAVISDDRMLVAYRDRGDDERRDIALVRYDGIEWHAPEPLHEDGWRIEACPVNGPALDARGGRVAAAWFTAADDEPRVRAAISVDGGESFGPALEIARGACLGRVDIVVTDEGGAIVSWLDATSGTGRLALRRIGADGKLGPRIEPIEMGVNRSSGFARLARLGPAEAGPGHDRSRHGSTLLVTWTDDTDDLQVRAAVAPMRSVP